MKKVLGLVRVSGEEQAQEGKTGIDRQRQDLARIAAANGLEVLRVYELIGISGTIIQQAPEFQAMVAELRRPDLEGLVVAQIDRLARTSEISDLEIFRHFIKPKRLIWTNSGVFDPSEFTGKLMLVFQSLFGGRERELIQERMHQGKEIRRRQADACPDPLPRGVQFDRQAKVYRYTPDAERVRTAFDMILAGKSILSTSKKLGYKNQRGLSIQLRNRIWIGYREYRHRRGVRPPPVDGKLRDAKKILREDPIIVRTNLADAPLITEVTFDAVQVLLDDKHRVWRNARREVSLFESSGLIRCGTCGDLYYSKWHSSARKGEGGYYYCKSKHAGGKGCGAKNADRVAMDDTLLRVLEQELSRPERLLELLESGRSQTAETRSSARTSELTTKQKRLQQEKERMIALLRTGCVAPDDPDVQRELRDIQTESDGITVVLKDNLRHQEAAATIDVQTLANVIASLFGEFRFLDRKNRKEFLRRVVDHVVVKDGGISAIKLRIYAGQNGQEAIPFQALTRDSKPESRVCRGSWRPPT
jgi:DNA invertase Pin-like site-specific DNA recombinase